MLGWKNQSQILGRGQVYVLELGDVSIASREIYFGSSGGEHDRVGLVEERPGGWWRLIGPWLG